VTPVSKDEHRQIKAAGIVSPGEGIKRYRDASFNAVAVKLLPGEHYVTHSSEEMIVTVLGSCVAACIRDPRVGVGGPFHLSRKRAWRAGAGSGKPSLRQFRNGAADQRHYQIGRPA
jgi:chemotaxis protein CheD